nr:preprotein translocase subunit YajC [Micromonospora sp. DSM 115978]
LIALVIVFFMSSSRKRKRAQEELISSLAPGSLVVTTSGMYGTLVEIDGGDALLEIAPDVVVRFSRAAIVRVVPPPPGDEDDTHSDLDDDTLSDVESTTVGDDKAAAEVTTAGDVDLSKQTRKEL